MKPKEVLTKLEIVIGVTGSPRRLRSAIESVLQDSFNLPALQAVEEAELLEGPIRDLIAEEEEITPSPLLTLVSSAEHIVAGYCYPDPFDSADVAAAKRSRLNIDPLLQEIRNLTFQEFELFGACVLKELGAKLTKVTPHSNDQGIDFYGVLSLGQNSFLSPPFGQLAHDVRLRFAGQAKHYPTIPIGPEMIRNLVGAISLARHKVFTTDDEIFDELELLPFNPLVAMFFTTGRFTSGALDLAAKSGVIAKSGEELAVFLADKSVGMYDDKGTVKFDKTRFRNWLSSR
jgi:hypothetical protein